MTAFHDLPVSVSLAPCAPDPEIIAFSKTTQTLLYLACACTNFSVCPHCLSRDVFSSFRCQLKCISSFLHSAFPSFLVKDLMEWIASLHASIDQNGSFSSLNSEVTAHSLTLSNHLVNVSSIFLSWNANSFQLRVKKKWLLYSGVKVPLNC